ncbi:AAA family ATPase [Streptomyces sp. URMC 123]|uniref:helix-turn-helix transcriptional regulator n=1 Tax=Streptomyces sp. URMC 123 TaxID=3423403 RepID=UPI003F1DC802
MALIDRSTELDTLRAALADCAAGRPRTVLIRGATGLGKTALLDAFAEHAAGTGALVLRARAEPAGSGLPLGVVRRLTEGLPPAARARALRGRADPPPGHGPPAVPVQGPLLAQNPRAFTALLRRLGATAPVVCCVDDLHHADEASLRHLQHLVRHVGPARVLLVCALTGPGGPGRQPLGGTEPPHRPPGPAGAPLQVLTLRPLTAAGVAALVRARPGLGRPESLAADLLALAGGSPLLSRALLDDWCAAARDPARAPRAHPGPGPAFARAVSACARGAGPAAAAVATALAVLDGLGTADRVARLLDTGRAEVSRGLAALHAAGLLDDEHAERFRHPAVRGAVLAASEPGLRARLRLRAAELTYAAGRAAAEVAGHLLAAAEDTGPETVGPYGTWPGTVGPYGTRPGAERPPWAVDVLREAAEHLAGDGEAERAVAALELAHAACQDPGQRAEIAIRLAGLSWRIDPAASERHLAEPRRAAREGRLPGRLTGPLARVLMLHGRVGEAIRTQARATGGAGEAVRTPGGSTDRAAEVVRARAPDSGRGAGGPGELVRGPSTGRGAGTDDGGRPGCAGSAEAGATVGHGATGRRAAVPWLVADPDDDAAAADADRFLERAELCEDTLEPIARALWRLLHARHPERAAARCEERVEEAAYRRAPGWQALFTALLAMALLRFGDPRGAERQALAALDRLPPGGGGGLACLPAAVVVRARTALGDHAAAARRLTDPAPEEYADSLYGLLLLRARGLHHLAVGRPRPALADFLRVGRLTAGWDSPLLLPWRGDAAEALLRSGDPRRAEELLLRQLAHPDARHPWVRGVSLRLLAATAAEGQRVPLLHRAVHELRRAGDREELARAVADLGAARAPGTTAAAALDPADPADALGAGPAPGDVLSASERRVAALAAQGCRNREISRRLFITVSTVEQHLTRVYRKLDITGRRDLAEALGGGGGRTLGRASASGAR